MRFDRQNYGSLRYHADASCFAGHQNLTSVASALAAIDVKDFAGHEAGPFEVEDRVDDVGDLAQTADRVQGGELCILLDGMHWRLDVARRDRVHSDAAFGILYCE